MFEADSARTHFITVNSVSIVYADNYAIPRTHHCLFIKRSLSKAKVLQNSENNKPYLSNILTGDERLPWTLCRS